MSVEIKTLSQAFFDYAGYSSMGVLTMHRGFQLAEDIYRLTTHSPKSISYKVTNFSPKTTMVLGLLSMPMVVSHATTAIDHINSGHYTFDDIIALSAAIFLGANLATLFFNPRSQLVCGIRLATFIGGAAMDTVGLLTAKTREDFLTQLVMLVLFNSEREGPVRMLVKGAYNLVTRQLLPIKLGKLHQPLVVSDDYVGSPDWMRTWDYLAERNEVAPRVRQLPDGHRDNNTQLGIGLSISSWRLIDSVQNKIFYSMASQDKKGEVLGNYNDADLLIEGRTPNESTRKWRKRLIQQGNIVTHQLREQIPREFKDERGKLQVNVFNIRNYSWKMEWIGPIVRVENALRQLVIRLSSPVTRQTASQELLDFSDDDLAALHTAAMKNDDIWINASNYAPHVKLPGFNDAARVIEGVFSQSGRLRSHPNKLMAPGNCMPPPTSGPGDFDDITFWVGPDYQAWKDTSSNMRSRGWDLKIKSEYYTDVNAYGEHPGSLYNKLRLELADLTTRQKAYEELLTLSDDDLSALYVVACYFNAHLSTSYIGSTDVSRILLLAYLDNQRPGRSLRGYPNKYVDPIKDNDRDEKIRIDPDLETEPDLEIVIDPTKIKPDDWN